MTCPQDADRLNSKGNSGSVAIRQYHAKGYEQLAHRLQSATPISRVGMLTRTAYVIPKLSTKTQEEYESVGCWR